MLRTTLLPPSKATVGVLAAAALAISGLTACEPEAAENATADENASADKIADAALDATLDGVAPVEDSAVVDHADSAAPAGAPDWVARGSIKDGETVWGVGKVKGIKNHALARTTCDNRARAQVAEQVGKQPLSRVQVVDRWLGPDGSFYALAKLALEVETAQKP